MKPYYSEGGITIFHGDCRDVLPTLPSVDLVLTDPPYAEQTHAGARTAARRPENYHEKDPGVLLDFDSFTDATMRECFDMIGRVAAGWVVSFMDWRHLAGFEASPPKGLRFVRFGIWVKPNGAPQFTGDRPATGWEAIAILHRENGKMAWNGGGHHAVWTCNKAHQDSYPGNHRTVKPLPLVCDLVRLFSNPGDTILDCFAGTGTVGVAARMLGRKAILIEAKEEYCNDAIERLQQAPLPLEIVEPAKQEQYAMDFEGAPV